MSLNRKVEQEDLGTLHDSEVELLWLIRTRFRFGEVTILSRDGLPVTVLKTIERANLGSGTYQHADIVKRL